MAYITHGLDLKNGIALKAAALIAADTNGTGVTVGKGFYLCRVVWTAAEIASNDEIYAIRLEANTVAADSTWAELGPYVLLAATEVNGGAGDAPATGDVVFGVMVPTDYQVRYAVYVNGTIATGANFAVDLHPMEQVAF